jgi:Mg-chelatase subunit ChlI
VSIQRFVYPFSAIVGQNELKLALLLNAINPLLGGLLIRGQKGTGKSSSVMALAEILPKVSVVKDCPFNCSPRDPTNMCPTCLSKHKEEGELEEKKARMKIISLPIGSTDDRVLGSLDIEKAINQGIRALQPGLLAEANQNILYIDEVNLLPDHITDNILDAAASGWNTVEREGISVSHPSRFILIGTMNPEEGELRPQLSDRFALHTTVEGIYDIEQRIEIIKRNLEFGEDPIAFSNHWEPEQEKLRKQILAARTLLMEIKVPSDLLRSVASACIKLHVDGHRPDIATIRASKALAALRGRDEISKEDIIEVATMAVGYRSRGFGFEEPAKPSEVRDVFSRVLDINLRR